MSHKLTGFTWFFLVLIGSLFLAACAPKINEPAQQTKNEPVFAAPPKPITHNTSQAKNLPSTRLESLISTLINRSTSLKIAGNVEKQLPDAWVVGGKTVQLNTSTQIQGNPGPQSQVDVQGFLDADGALLAHQISISDIEAVATSEISSTGTFEIAGIVTSILTDTWVIGTQEVLVDANTEIESGLAVGSLAKVEGYVLPDGSYLAHEISMVYSEEEELYRKFQIVDSLEAMDGSIWLIGGFTVTIDGNTHLGEGLAVGLTVKVKGLVMDDGTLLARYIQLVHSAVPQPEEIEFTGLLTAMNADLWTVNQISVTITTTTEIKGDPQVGDTVKVEGIQQADGSVLAHDIKVIGGDPEPTETPEPTEMAKVEFTGLLTAMNGNIWTVNDVSVVITSTTEIEGDPQAGDTVKVEGIQQADGSVLAHEIKVKQNRNPGATETPEHRQMVDFTGIVTAINGNTWVIDGTTVLVTAETKISGNPQIGDTVNVKGITQDDGSVLAREIEKESGNPDNRGHDQGGSDKGDNGGGDKSDNGKEEEKRGDDD